MHIRHPVLPILIMVLLIGSISGCKAVVGVKDWAYRVGEKLPVSKNAQRCTGHWAWCSNDEESSKENIERRRARAAAQGMQPPPPPGIGGPVYPGQIPQTGNYQQPAYPPQRYAPPPPAYPPANVQNFTPPAGTPTFDPQNTPREMWPKEARDAYTAQETGMKPWEVNPPWKEKLRNEYGTDKIDALQEEHERQQQLDW